MNCQPHDLAVIFTCHVGDRQVLPEEALGAVVRVGAAPSASPANGLLQWRFTNPVGLVARTSFSAYGPRGRCMVWAGDKIELLGAPDACLQPIRGVKTATPLSNAVPA